MGVKTKTVGVKIPKDLLRRVERWIQQQGNPDITLSDAIRALLRKALSG